MSTEPTNHRRTCPQFHVKSLVDDAHPLGGQSTQTDKSTIRDLWAIRSDACKSTLSVLGELSLWQEGTHFIPWYSRRPVDDYPSLSSTLSIPHWNLTSSLRPCPSVDARSAESGSWRKLWQRKSQFPPILITAFLYHTTSKSEHLGTVYSYWDNCGSWRRPF